MGRSPCCSHEELRKGAWTVQEDQKLIAYIQKHGTGSWRTLPQKAGLQRCGKSCRLRWFNYLRPDIKRGKLSQEEEQTIIKLQAVLGNRWSSIAKHLPKRTDNEIKNYWNSYLRKQFEKNAGDSSSPKPISSDSSPESKSNDMCMVPLEKTDCHEPNTNQSHQHKLSKSTSSSTHLLNKVASKILASGYLEAIKSCQPVVAGNSKSEGVVKSGIGPQKDNIRDPLVPNLTSPSHSVTSAKLLNKMATSLPHKVYGLEAVKAVFSKLMESSEKGGIATSDGSSFVGSDQVGSCLNALSPFEDGPHISKIIDSPSSPTLMFNQVTTPSCFSEDNEDNWQCVSSNYVSFRNCAASGGGGDCSVSEINLGESSSSTSCFLFENADLGTCDDEIRKYIQYL
ncbi:hypothetical protein AAZX31_06G186600 [Glycine max]|uniref:MYB/HD-like transcription factor n=3 Tax=Glycine subgen. Soja TaxID=1462606 RepID=I1KCU7_SOYBN|nr:transcription factor MYB51 [Glycine max]XP_028237269.1 transcription factor MYB51-like [Glycine soja]KAG5019849.1 hypothetical protein JHK87_015704 [Glycine soja]KAG5032174.1 hypothetical protein JHK85_016156 [Glycine max]KAG5046383.1 hypothetical protein JHK86_015789 [Glycine max]KAG5148879.1 hypothetical protein JHK82_015760 [Glycine max]KAH1126699.1 hypothetical protein GYH30_015630 [Glycine max]|eukprot:XP_003528196.1 transcription factor MYB51 [Glycine max]